MLPRYHSDHNALLLSTKRGSLEHSHEKAFRLEPIWLTDEGCAQVIKAAWEEGSDYEPWIKIVLCAERLKSWSKITFASIKYEIKAIEKQLIAAQKRQPYVDNIDLCKELGKKLDDLHRKQETF